MGWSRVGTAGGSARRGTERSHGDRSRTRKGGVTGTAKMALDHHAMGIAVSSGNSVSGIVSAASVSPCSLGVPAQPRCPRAASVSPCSLGVGVNFSITEGSHSFVTPDRVETGHTVEASRP